MSQNVVWLVAFHFPPIKISSGLERTVSLARHLHRFGWAPIVITAHPRAYATTSAERLKDIPNTTQVVRAFALDTSRHLSIGGRYWSFMARPDRWVSWLLGGVFSGITLGLKQKPKVIWSTYPIATAHLIGFFLHKFTGIPWIADFRDPMVEYDEVRQHWAPPDARLRKTWLLIEKLAIRHASALTFCTTGALEIYKARYPDAAHHTWCVIPNGFDEDAFRQAEARQENRTTATAITLLHSGIIYPGPDRDPTIFLKAFKQFLNERNDVAKPIRIMFRASSVEDIYGPIVEQLNLSDSVFFGSAVPYVDALAEMLSSDGLLVFQGKPSNPAIPAKIYEYFRARRPILALVDTEGSTAQLLRDEKIGIQAPLDDMEQTLASLRTFIHDIEHQQSTTMNMGRVPQFDRTSGVRLFAELFTKVSKS